MSAGKEQLSPAAATQEQPGLLDEITRLMPETVEASRKADIIAKLVQEAMKGTVTWDKNVTKTINNAIEQIDKVRPRSSLLRLRTIPSSQKLSRGLQARPEAPSCSVLKPAPR